MPQIGRFTVLEDLGLLVFARFNGSQKAKNRLFGVAVI